MRRSAPTSCTVQPRAALTGWRAAGRRRAPRERTTPGKVATLRARFSSFDTWTCLTSCVVHPGRTSANERLDERPFAHPRVGPSKPTRGSGMGSSWRFGGGAIRENFRGNIRLSMVWRRRKRERSTAAAAQEASRGPPPFFSCLGIRTLGEGRERVFCAPRGAIVGSFLLTRRREPQWDA